MAFARTVIENVGVREQIEAAREKYPRIEEVWDAWLWRLARDPNRDAFPLGNGLYSIKTTDLSNYGLPEGITLLYSFTEDEVTIISIRVL